VPHRRLLLDLLARYRPADEQDRAQAARLIDFVKREPACFDRACPEGHVTGSAWLVDPTGRHVLLTHHRKLDMWLQLGGHADGSGDVLSVAMREAREESGLSPIEPALADVFDVDVHPIPARPGEPAHFHYDVRFALRAGRTDFQVSEESHSLAWIEIDKLSDRTTERSLLRMAEKWKKIRPPS
jgi:8-oxo-dGTP pyrophosphatase MutT (NUDIX family)